MAPLARVVVTGVSYHITQGGNRRCQTCCDDENCGQGLQSPRLFRRISGSAALNSSARVGRKDGWSGSYE